MSGANIQPRTVNQPSAQKHALPSQNGNDLREAIWRAFEVTRAIEGAIRVETTESLEQFINRVMSKFFERTEGTTVRIVRVKNMDVIGNLGHLQVHDHAPNSDNPASASDCDLSSYASGHPIGLSVWFESPDEEKRINRLMRESGFIRDSLFQGSSSGFASCEWRDKSDLSSRLVANVACSILQNLWGIEAKKEVACFFDHEEKLSSQTIRSSGDLKQWIEEVARHEPMNAILNVYTSSEDKIIQVARALHGMLRLRVSPGIASEEKYAKIQAFMREAAYVTDSDYGDDCWLGKEDVDFVAVLLGNVLHTGGIILESDQLRGDLHLKRCFV